MAVMGFEMTSKQFRSDSAVARDAASGVGDVEGNLAPYPNVVLKTDGQNLAALAVVAESHGGGDTPRGAWRR